MRRAVQPAVLLAFCAGCAQEEETAPEPVVEYHSVAQGVGRWRQGRYGEAYADFAASAAARPGSELGRFPEAQWRCGPRMPVEHAAALAANWAGTACANAGDGAGAVDWYGKAIAADPSLPLPWRNRGILRARAGDLAGAREDLKGWASCDPRYSPFLEDGDLLPFQAGRGEALAAEAEAGWRAELEGSPLTAFRRYAKAYALLDLLQDSDRAWEASRAADLVRAWRKAAVKPTLPREGWRHLVRAQEYAKSGLFADAAESYRRVALGSPWYLDAYVNRAMILEEMQEYPDAIETLNRCLDLFPDAPEARQLQAKARSLRAQLVLAEAPCPEWKPWLGARFDTATPVILALVPGSPAERGGLKRGDQVLKAFGDPVSGTEAFLAVLRARQPGQILELVVSREGREVRLQVPVGHRALGR